MYESDDDEAIERMALEDLSRRARGSRFADRMPEDRRAGFTLVVGQAEPDGDEVEETAPAGQDFRQANENFGRGLHKNEDEDLDEMMRRALR
jgi:hypothetical protein